MFVPGDDRRYFCGSEQYEMLVEDNVLKKIRLLKDPNDTMAIGYGALVISGTFTSIAPGAFEMCKRIKHFAVHRSCLTTLDLDVVSEMPDLVQFEISDCKHLDTITGTLKSTSDSVSVEINQMHHTYEENSSATGENGNCIDEDDFHNTAPKHPMNISTTAFTEVKITFLKLLYVDLNLNRFNGSHGHLIRIMRCNLVFDEKLFSNCRDGDGANASGYINPGDCNASFVGYCKISEVPMAAYATKRIESLFKCGNDIIFAL